jgi:hypothetical protein
MKILTHGKSGVGHSHGPATAHQFSQDTMFAPHPDGTFTVDMSEWSNGGFPDPLTARTVYGFKRYLAEDKDREGEVLGWSGTLPSGAKLTVFND